MGQPTPGVPVYTVKSIAGGTPKVLHRNLLLPLQGRIRQEGWVGEEGSSYFEVEEEGGDEMPKVARTPRGRPRDLRQVPLIKGMPMLCCLNRKPTPC